MVQNRPTESPHYDKFDHDARKNLQHREALRVALGSILAPKRSPLAPGSRSSSGTASPAYPFPLPATPPIPPSGYGGSPIDYLHPMHGLYQSHPHPPSRLGRSSSNSNSPRETSASNSPHPSPLPIPPVVTTDSSLPSPLEPDGLSPLPPSAVSVEGADAIPHIRGVPPPPPVVHPMPMPVHSRRRPSAPPPAAGDGGSVPPSGVATPRAKFLETLGSKSAWDALIHGSFS